MSGTTPAEGAIAPLHPATADLVSRFSAALADKLAAAQQTHGRTDDWARDDWQTECQQALQRHVVKGDPLDVAAYAAFCWARGWPTTSSNLGEYVGEHDPETFAAVGVPIAAVFRSIDQLRGFLENGSADISAGLVDDAFLQAHMLGVASIIAAGADEHGERLIERFADQLRNTVPVARLLR